MSSFIDDGGVILNITQCSSGSVQQGLYESSSIFNEIGVVSGQDMTAEAALTKMMTILTGDNAAEAALLLAQNIRGELTPT